MKMILAWLALLLLTAAAPAVINRPTLLCNGPDGPCPSTMPDHLPVRDGEVHLQRAVFVDPDALPLTRPLMVWVSALASSEVRWNGVLIGHNGQPGPDAASETPGLYAATFEVPVEMVRPGENMVSLRLSAHHLPLPVRDALHEFRVTPYETPELPGFDDYFPALLTIGALAAVLVYFLVAGAIDRGQRGAWWVAAVAGSVILQLVVESGRAFIAYTYPWHVARVLGIALLAATTATLAAAYAAQRFAPEWGRAPPVLVAGAGLAAIIFIPWFDPKALAATLAGLMTVAACALQGARHGRSGAGAALAGSLAMIALLLWQFTSFLDRTYFLGVTVLLFALVAEQVVILRHARQRRDAETRRAAALEERLKQAIDAGETIVELRNGNRIDRVAESDILYIRAADDYCDVVLADGRTLLVTANLARLLSGLPEPFVRVHKSYAVNRRHVTNVSPRGGGGRQLLLGENVLVPVGRSYGEAVARWGR